MSNPLPEQLWTSTQVAEYLQLKEESVRRLARQGKIVGYKIGDGPRADWRFDLASVRNCLLLRSVSRFNNGEQA
jgi:excisionase family DNA binding protein